MLDHVVERLLGDAVERLLDIQRQAIRQVGLQQDGEPDAALERRHMGPQRLDEPVALEARRPQLEQERAHLGERLTLELAQLLELLERRLAVPGQQHLDGAGHEGHREQRLGHRVVELARQMGPLGARCQLGGLATQVALEPAPLGQVARGAVSPDELAVTDHARGEVLERDDPTIAVPQREARHGHPRRDPP